jgi:hypothetical protein
VTKDRYTDLRTYKRYLFFAPGRGLPQKHSHLAGRGCGLEKSARVRGSRYQTMAVRVIKIDIYFRNNLGRPWLHGMRV